MGPFEADMVAGDAAASIAALAAVIRTAALGEPAVVTLNGSNGDLTAETQVDYGSSFTLTIGTNEPVVVTVSPGTLGDLLTQINSTAGIASAEIVNGDIVITTTAIGTSASLMVEPSVSFATFPLIASDSQSDTGTDAGTLAGVVGNVSVSGGMITLTSAVAETQTFEITNAEIDYPGVKEVIEVAFSNNSSDYFETANDGTTAGKVSITIAGVTVEVDMVANDVGVTLENLVSAIQAKMNAGSPATLGTPDINIPGDPPFFVPGTPGTPEIPAGELYGVISSVTRSNATLSITAFDPADTDLSVSAATTQNSVVQVTEIDLSGADEYSFMNYADNDSQTGEVTVTIAGHAITAAMGYGRLETIENLKTAIELARDGSYTSALTNVASAIDDGVNGDPAEAALVVLSAGAGKLLTDVLTTDTVTINLAVNNVPKSLEFNPLGHEKTVGDLIDDLNTLLAGDATASLVSGGIQIVTTLTGSAALISVGEFSFNQISAVTSSMNVLVHDALGTVEIDGTDATKLQLTAKNGGADPLNVSLTGTIKVAPDPQNAESSTYQDVTLTFSNSGLTGLPTGTKLNLFIAGNNIQYVVGSGDTPETIVIGIKDALLAAIASPPEGVDLAVDPTSVVFTPSPSQFVPYNFIGLAASSAGPDVLGSLNEGDARQIKLTATTDNDQPYTLASATLAINDNPGRVEWLDSGSGSIDGVTINDTTGEGTVAVTGADASTVVDSDSSTDTLNVTNDVTAGDDDTPIAQTTDNTDTGISPSGIDQDYVNPNSGRDASGATGGNADFYGDSALIGATGDTLFGIDQDYVNPDSGRGASGASGDAGFYGDSALAGTTGGVGATGGSLATDVTLNGIDQDYLNPDNGRGASGASGDASFFGDAGSSGASGGVDQSYTNPDNAYVGTSGSPQANVNGATGGVDSLYGAASGYYDNDGLYTDHVDGVAGSTGAAGATGDTLFYTGLDNINIGVGASGDGGVAGATAGVTTDTGATGDALTVTAGDNGFAAFDWDAAFVNYLSRGNADADVINNFQVGSWVGEDYVGDTITLEGDLAASTLDGIVSVTYGQILGTTSNTLITTTPSLSIDYKSITMNLGISTADQGFTIDLTRGSSTTWTENYPNVATLKNASGTVVANPPYVFFFATNLGLEGQLDSLMVNVPVEPTTFTSVADFVAYLNENRVGRFVEPYYNEGTYNYVIPEIVGVFENGALTLTIPSIEAGYFDSTAPQYEYSIVEQLPIKTGFNLSTDEFGLVTSADNSDAGTGALQSIAVQYIDGIVSGDDQSSRTSSVKISVDGGNTMTTYSIGFGDTMADLVDKINLGGLVTAAIADGDLVIAETVVGQELQANFNFSFNTGADTLTGLVTTAVETSVDSSELANATEVAALLNSLFDFDAADNGEIDTSVFAVTASDDPTKTAIWSHQQSFAGDTTVDAVELNLLAIVNTTGDEFNAQNFGNVNFIV
jgi:hypothetical protein